MLYEFASDGFAGEGIEMRSLNQLSNGCFLGLAMVLVVAFTSDSYGHGDSVFPDSSKSRSGPRTFPKPDPGAFVNFETAHVNPVALSPDGSTLAVCNTPDAHLEIYSLNEEGLLLTDGGIPVGYDPVSVRFRTNTEVWVVNHVSDSISVVDLTTNRVTSTINTADEPTDVVFFTDSGNSANLAAVSCSQPDLIQVYNAGTHAFVDEVKVLGQDPRALVTDGTRVFAAIFQSGNATTGIRDSAAPMDNAGNPYGGSPSDGQFFNNGIPGTGWMTPDGLKTPTDLANEGKPNPPRVGLIVRKDFSDGEKWKDDNGADWTQYISGANSAGTRRPMGWDVLDHDIVAIKTTNGTTSVDTTFGTNGHVDFGTTINAAGRRMNICMALGINPSDNSLMLVGTDATNEIRFEPVLKGRFIRVMAGIATSAGVESAFVDFNEDHLANATGGAAYTAGSIPQSERNKSIGNPRSVAFDPTGSRAYVTGKGSGNIAVLDAATGLRLGGISHAIDLGLTISSSTTGPTGAVHHGSMNRLYVVNRFESSVVVVDTTSLGNESILQRKSMHDPTPEFINTGRIQFYDSHMTSGLGHIACASCHIDGRMDQLAWDLGDPFGDMKTTNAVDVNNPLQGEHNLLFVEASGGLAQPFDDFNFMKGPMATQTLQDIIGQEPHHWRGDKDGIEEFAGAFSGLQGRDEELEAIPMQEFEDFLGSIHFMPNPFRPVDNSLPGGPQLVGGGTNPLLSLDGYQSDGATGNYTGVTPRGTPLPDGDAFRGFQLYVEGNPIHTGGHSKAPEPLSGVFHCVICHALPTGAGSVDFFDTNTDSFVDILSGPMGEAHQAMISEDSGDEKAFKIPPLRNQMDKNGFNIKPNPNDGGNPHISTHGFGVLHDGSIDNIDTFVGLGVFDMDSDQDIADMVAFMLCLNGDGFSDLAGLPGAPTFSTPASFPVTGGVDQLGPEGSETQTGHAAVGKQVTINSGTPPASDLALINTLVTLAEDSKIDLVVKGVKDGNNRGWYLTPDVRRAPGDNFVSDINTESNTLAELLAFAGASTPMTFMGVPEGLGLRMGVDRDEDMYFNFTEVINGTNPANPLSFGMPMGNGGTFNYALTFGLLTLCAAGYLLVLVRNRRTNVK
jgi:YVTN family beta-propeller protein